MPEPTSVPVRAPAPAATTSASPTSGSPTSAAATAPRTARYLRLAADALALAGWVMGIALFSRWTVGGFPIGVDLAAYIRAGNDLVAGNPVYVGEIGQLGAFSYAPPWAVFFGALSWVPDLLMQVGVMALGLLCIRYVATSWLWAGLVFLYPVSVNVLFSGNIEFFIAAAIVLAANKHSGPLALMSMAKISPVFGIPRSGWKEAGMVVGIALLVTLPWLTLWPEWIDYLLRQPSTIAIHFGPPWYVRMPFALGLLLLRRPWASALAVVVGMPSLWLGTLVILSAVVRLWFDGRTKSQVSPTPQA